MATESFPKRYFLITNGRSGSSLLSALLADAGADFGMPAPEHWDVREGRMENPHAERASHHYRRAFDIDHGRRYILLPQLEARYRRKRGRRCLRRALGEAGYIKAANLDLLIQPAFRLGYLPQVILIYRRFEPNLASLLAGLSHIGPDELTADYLRVYRQGLMLLCTFGGCAVAYEQLVDADDRRWASALAGLTGLSESALVDARAQRLDRRTVLPQSAAADVYPEVSGLYEALDGLAGRVIEPAHAVQRDMRLRLQNRGFDTAAGGSGPEPG